MAVNEIIKKEEAPVIQVKNLIFSYEEKQKGKIILNNVDLTIPKGKITTLIGANGCGKSTLFNLMTKNLEPNRGKIYLDGTNIRGMKQKEFAKRVAIVHQNNEAAADITVSRLVSYGRSPHLGMFGTMSAKDKELVDWALEVTQIKDLRDREVTSLSGGQRQRVWIAMALAQKTDILFLDEPTTYLDIRYQIELLEMIQRLNQEYQITIIMVLHDMNHAVYYSDEILGLKDGSVLVQGNPEEVITADCIEHIYGVRLNVEKLNGKKIVMTVR
ncbi:ABC transporter ATP-binding protein [Konateibacter massiliensis]|uniref:ABC transporter ATP-binding protein n=1 Tax=Konateibacter massiliensis TaxID=2002841 RepID=UPI000C1472D5|nr:ABC transporter ATP-binding protein [Konateibacter massiliensis]